MYTFSLYKWTLFIYKNLLGVKLMMVSNISWNIYVSGAIVFSKISEIISKIDTCYPKTDMQRWNE